MQPDYDVCSYEISTREERLGTMCRKVRVAIIEGEGHSKLLDREEWDTQGVLWQPVEQPSILKNFKSWFNVTAYKYTGNENYIREEFYG